MQAVRMRNVQDQAGQRGIGRPSPRSMPAASSSSQPTAAAGVTVVKILLIIFVSIVGFSRGSIATLYDPPTQPYEYNPAYGAENPAYTPLIKGPTQPFFHPVGWHSSLRHCCAGQRSCGGRIRAASRLPVRIPCQHHLPLPQRVP